MSAATTPERINQILNRRWPEALIGEKAKYHGPLVGQPYGGPVDWIKTDMGWEPDQGVKSVARFRANREAKARYLIDSALGPLPPIKRQRVIDRIVRQLGLNR